jgi:hypothetical protein
MSPPAELLWTELEARAERLLEHAKEVEPRDRVRRYGSLLRLWHYPAFGPRKTWTILQPGRKVEAGAATLVRELTWDRDADHQRIFERLDQQAAPTIRLREAGLPAAELGALLETGAGLAVSVVGVTHTAGLEGEFFGLETYEVSPNIRVQWWCAGPTEWHHFITWVAELRALLTRCLDQAG